MAEGRGEEGMGREKRRRKRERRREGGREGREEGSLGEEKEEGGKWEGEKIVCVLNKSSCSDIHPHTLTPSHTSHTPSHPSTHTCHSDRTDRSKDHRDTDVTKRLSVSLGAAINLKI